jgi:hypothetical protein
MAADQSSLADSDRFGSGRHRVPVDTNTRSQLDEYDTPLVARYRLTHRGHDLPGARRIPPVLRHPLIKHERRFVTWTKVGVPIEIVQLILGLSSPAVTRRIYAHVMKKATAEQVGTASRLITKHRRDQSVTKPTAVRRAQSRPFKDLAGQSHDHEWPTAGSNRRLSDSFSAGRGVRRGSIYVDQQASDLRFYCGQGRGRTADLPIFRWR